MATNEPLVQLMPQDAGPGRRVMHAFSAGGIVLRGLPAEREILLVGRAQALRGGQLWALPKGTPLPGESAQQTALREVREETGIEVAITGHRRGPVAARPRI
jgi:8-oxo-dGTP pyrophosphatase MutT (NUDIX family)